MAKPARQTDTEDWLEQVLQALSDTSDFLATYQDTIDGPDGTPTADLKQTIDDLLSSNQVYN